MSVLTSIGLYSPFQPTISAAGLDHYGLKIQSAPATGVLSPMVYRYIHIEAQAATQYPVIPDGTQALYFSHNACLLSSGLTQPAVLRLADAGHYYGIHFYPAAIARIFKRDFGDIANSVVDAQFLPKDFVEKLHGIFYQTISFRDKVRCCASLLLRYSQRAAGSIAEAPLIDASLAQLYKNRGNLRVTELAHSLGYSERHLNRLYQRNLGISVKSFATVIRMQYLYRDCQAAKSISLDRCLQYGYYDQSHFIKDFRRLVGSAAF